jgi:hypothetical protein
LAYFVINAVQPDDFVDGLYDLFGQALGLEILPLLLELTTRLRSTPTRIVAYLGYYVFEIAAFD